MFLAIFSGLPSHKNSKSDFIIKQIKCSGGFSSTVSGNVILGIANVFITVILPINVKGCFFHLFNMYFYLSGAACLKPVCKALFGY